jgi:LacI family transcriptional regulator
MHVAGADHITIYRARKEGYLDAMANAGIEVPAEWILQRPLVLEGGESAFQTCFDSSTHPDAFFCAGDFAALGVMQAALKKGLSIPTDLGITGFANEPFTAFLQPSLTTVDQRGSEMGGMVAEMFLNCEERESQTMDCEKVVLKPKLVIRNSSLLNK